MSELNTTCALCLGKQALLLHDHHLRWHFAQGSFSYSSRSAARLRTLVFLRSPPPSRTPPSRRRAASSLAYTPSSWVYRPYICVFERQKKKAFIQVVQVGGSERSVKVMQQEFSLKRCIQYQVTVNRDRCQNIHCLQHHTVHSSSVASFRRKKKPPHSALTQQSRNDFFSDR